MSKARTLTTRLATRMLRTRWFVRAPIWLFRVRLGFLFGHRLLMLEHVGRKSGLARYVALEVVARVGDEYTVTATPTPRRASGHGSARRSLTFH